MSQDKQWINRKLAEELENTILTQKESERNGVRVFYIKAPGGAGKTFLARDLGTRFGSDTGYEPGNRSGVFWSGILDLYDPDTNNNRGIEQLLIHAFSDHPSSDFKDYYDERAIYVKLSTGGTGGPPLEDQRKIIERAFSREMRGISRDKQLVLVFDTVERIQSALDPTESQLGELGHLEDTASVMGWLIFQISRLAKATVLLFGRPAPQFENYLRSAIAEASLDRDRSFGSIQFEVKDLYILADDEVQDFFAFQQEKYPPLTKILSPDVKKLLADSTESNPLLLDIAIQTILKTGRLDEVREALQKKDNMLEVGKKLIKAYMDHGTTEQKLLLEYLALARNGLFPELLHVLKPPRDSMDSLQRELERMSELPFVKTRHISVSSQDPRNRRPTYFLHDAMYEICDAALLKPVQAREDCKKILAWYEHEADRQFVEEKSRNVPTSDDQSGGRRDDPVKDLLVESLFYRLRSDPNAGYIWYLREAEAAFRSVNPGYEMRLGDSMAQFAVNADPKGENDSARSVVDAQNIKTLMPDLWDQFSIDSAMMWVRRLSFRARHADAVRVAEKATWAEEIFSGNRERYCLSFAELKVWQAQSLMYLGKAKEAAQLYEENLSRLDNYSLEHLRKNKHKYSDFEVRRICFIKGRSYNNLGYTYWMYFGKYKAALAELSQAIEYFKEAGLTEEEATTLDNIGRIHAALWHQPAAQMKIKEGLVKRESEGEKARYRLALSLISLASIQHRFGNSQLALENVNKAYEIFNTMVVRRGLGLAFLTRAMIYRSMAESWREIELSHEKAVEYTKLAIKDLENAIRIFEESVQETIRYVFALNEMGSCYRCLYLLQMFGVADEQERLKILNKGIDYYSKAITNARKHDYFIEELDSRQDMAVLYARARSFEKAADELEQIEKVIPITYKIMQNSGLQPGSEFGTVDAYYKIMGQVEMLKAAMIFDQLDMHKRSVDGILQSTEHYVLGIAYYYRFSAVSSNTYVTAVDRIYRRLNQCDRTVLTNLKNVHLNEWIKKYAIPAEWVKPLFDEVFEMLGI
jgi:tetratricopeptide (TPR) repeat protein